MKCEQESLSLLQLDSFGPLTSCDIIQKCVRDGGTNKMVLSTRHMTCHKNAQCKNVIGDYKCQCNRGYEGDGVAKCTRKYLVHPGNIQSVSVLLLFKI